jgi:hypothetical protein
MEKKMRSTSFRNHGVSINHIKSRNVKQQGTRLIPLMLQRKGFPSEIFYVPECFECGKPILDFRDANVSTVDQTDEDLIPIGKLGDADAFLIPSAGAFAVCKTCDETGPHSPQLQSGTSNYPAQEPRMTPTKELSPVEIAIVYMKNKKSGREQMRFFPRCCDCRKILLDISEANLAAVDCENFKSKRIATRGDLEILQQSGRALVFRWDCDRKKNRVPWQSALGTFRALDEPQRCPEPIRKRRKR